MVRLKFAGKKWSVGVFGVKKCLNLIELVFELEIFVELFGQRFGHLLKKKAHRDSSGIFMQGSQVKYPYLKGSVFKFFSTSSISSSRSVFTVLTIFHSSFHQFLSFSISVFTVFISVFTVSISVFSSQFFLSRFTVFTVFPPVFPIFSFQFFIPVLQSYATTVVMHVITCYFV